jgi:hypothetical protein
MPAIKADGVDGRIHKNIQTTTVYTTDKVVKGQVVMINTAVTAPVVAFKADYGAHRVVKLCDVDDTPLAAGVALTSSATTSAGAHPTGTVQAVQIQFAGINGGNAAGATGVPQSDGAITAAQLISASTTTDGRIRAAAAPTGALWPFAMCVIAYAANETDGTMMIFNKGWYDQ